MTKWKVSWLDKNKKLAIARQNDKLASYTKRKVSLLDKLKKLAIATQNDELAIASQNKS